MNKIFTGSFYFLLFLIVFSSVPAFAQTIIIGNVDAGPYGKGSTIAVPFHINDASGCITQTNIFSLYLCDASGNIISSKASDTLRNFYATFFNFKIPNGTTAGTYTFVIKSSAPAVTSNISNTFTITTANGLTAGASSQSIGNANYPEVYGSCSGANNIPYTFTNTSTGGSTVTASFFNELTQTSEASNISLASPYNFVANTANYTVVVKAVNSSNIVSTYAYQLINNVVNTSIGSTGNPSVCLNGGSVPITYNIDVSSSTGIQYNYPGNTYTFKWGDGTPNSTYTLCQIKALNGQVVHYFASPSCGITSNNHANSFEIDFQTKNLYCGNIGSAPSNYAKVFNEPLNSFTMPATACTGSQVTITNNSDPGPDPNATSSTCSSNPNALYTWSVDGVVVASGYHQGKNFVTTFTRGTHTVTLHLQNNTGPCQPADTTETICIQDPPKPAFSLAQTTVCMGGGPVTPTNTSVIDANCNVNNQYVWTVSPSTGVSFNSGSAQPQFTFNQPGIYSISLGITTASCGTVTTKAQTLVVNSSPAATLSPDFSVCGSGQTFSFDTNKSNNPTYTTLTGTAQPQASTYTWAVSGGSYSFAPGYSAHSQYPQIIFNDFATYTITVTQQNNCGSATATQHITFQKAPTINAGNDSTICAGTAANLNGTITGSGVISYKWTGGSGTFSPDANTLNAVYQPSQAEINAGHVTLTLTAATSVAAPCNSISSSVTFTITPTDAVTSGLTKTICSNNLLNYQATAKNAGSTFTWTAGLVSGSASGFTPNGSGSLINDLLVNTDPNASTNAVVAYTITPISSNGCPGTPSTLNVTVTPLPVLSAAPANPVICSEEPANIILNTKLSGTSYTWTSSSTGNVTGNTNKTTPVNTLSIQDLLVNNSSTPATVTYTITPFSPNSCQGNPVTTSITVQPLPVTANAGNNASICNTTSYQLQGNSPGSGTGEWTVVSGSGVTFTDDTDPQTTVNGLIGGNIYQFQWTITSAPGCQSQSTVTITVNLPTVPGTTSTSDPTTVCAGNNSGQIDLSGEVGSILRWEKSIDGGVTWQQASVGNTNAITYLNLTQTTQYRAVVQNGACSFLTSTVTTITVNQPPINADAGPDATLCNSTTYTLNGNDPGTFAGVWTQLTGPPVTFADSTAHQTIVSNLQEGNIYTFKWTIKGVLPCADSYDEVTITDAADVVANFTADKTDVCGATAINFTNQSNNQSGAVFLWDFGDGSTSNQVSPQHTFQPTFNGDDTTYTVSLSVVGNCNARPPVTQVITVRPQAPIATILPQATTGCSPFTISVKNTSPGNNVGYKFYLYTGSSLVQEIDKTDKSDATFNPVNVISPTTYTLYMVATGYCGATTTSNVIPINISPPTVTAQTYALNNNVTGCAPFSTTFVNNSLGGSSYHYNIYDSGGNLIAQPVAGTGNFPYTFNTAGTYSVSITAYNGCTTTGDESPSFTVTVYPLPQPAYTSSTGCDNTVTFTNTTPDNGSTPAASLSYAWDFGDNSPLEYSFTPQPHHYDYTKSPFTVTLTATNPVTGCATVTTQNIDINAPLIAAFTEIPDSVISIPDYQFTFVDRSTGGPSSWKWSFGDGHTSASQTPEHTYADTGYYDVTLTVANQTCSSTATNRVRITGVPGQLYLPNAFIPTSQNAALKIFMAKGSGIKNWRLQIFNNYGQLMWETTKLDDKGAPVDGWDGTFKGAPVPQGTYIWQASATFINGSQWKGMSYNNSLPKRTGTIILIR